MLQVSQKLCYLIGQLPTYQHLCSWPYETDTMIQRTFIVVIIIETLALRIEYKLNKSSTSWLIYVSLQDTALLTEWEDLSGSFITALVWIWDIRPSIDLVAGTCRFPHNNIFHIPRRGSNLQPSARELIGQTAKLSRDRK